MIAPLAGVRVLDLTHFVAGPWCTMLMGDFGADIVKVEPVGRGEISRSMGSVFADAGAGADSAIFLGFNRSKRSVALDLKSGPGQAVVRRLARRADVVVQNFRPSVAVRLGVDAASLRQLEPSLVCCAVTAFGEDGPMSGVPGNDPLIQGLSGAMRAGGAGPPVRLGVSVPDLAGGLLAAVGVLAALRRRSLTGEGATLVLNLLDAQLYAQTDRVAHPEARADDHVRPGTRGWVWSDPTDGTGREVPVATLGDVLPGPHSRVLELTRAGRRPTRMVRTPLDLDPPVPAPTRHPPALGEHTDEVLREHGYGADEVTELFRRGIVAGPDTDGTP